jgi:formylglycine-generating enzyme required for sulfatase activity
MARPAELNGQRSVLADVVRLWAQALQTQPGCEAPPVGWVWALLDQDADSRTPSSTLHLPAQSQGHASAELPVLLDTELPVQSVELPDVSVAQPHRLQAPVLAVVAADFQPESEQVLAAARLQDLSMLKPEDYEPLHPQEAAPWLPLAPRARWWPALRQFTPPMLAGPDLSRLVSQFSQGRPPRRLPRVQRRGRFQSLLVLQDQRRCMRPYRQDFETLTDGLKAQRQAVTVKVHGFDGLPPTVSAGVDAVLLLSDLGLCATPDPAATAKAWVGWARALTGRGVAVQAWVPVSAQRIPAALAQAMPCVPWHEHSRFRPSRGHANVQTSQRCTRQQAVWMARLWPLLAMAQRIEPALLRRARLLAGGQGQPEWEATLWGTTGEHVAGEEVLQFWPARVAFWRQAFAALPAAMQRQVWHMFTAQHAHLPRSTLVVERLIWGAYAVKPGAHDAMCEALAQAKDWLHRMKTQEALNSAAHPQQVQTGQDHALHAGFLHGLVQRNGADAEFTTQYAEDYASLALAVGRMGPGAGVDAEVWLQAIPPVWPQAERFPWSVQLHHRPQGVFIEKWINRAQPNALATPQASRLRPLLPQASRHSVLWQAHGQRPQLFQAAQPAGPGELHFRDAQGRHRLQLDHQRRADWQHALGCDRYGVFCEVQVKTMRLRFRNIPPGTYLQGSPENIGFGREHPQHPVTLTQGLWLAETPCTQALWQAVMGKNPSHFKDGADAPRRPVENVSWDDVTVFLKQLQPLLPYGCEAVLPTESQWEYACRAGTQTEYWWGDEPDDAHANWNEQHNDTTPVDRYPPNPWGLHDMHGNVWEWCADDQRDYAAEPARDPEGPDAGDFRVVRGGSWFDLPDFARAAYRDWGRRGFAFRDRGRGFRFALRSPGGPEALPGGLGASRRGGAAGGRTDGADAPAAEPPRRGAGDARTPE